MGDAYARLHYNPEVNGVGSLMALNRRFENVDAKSAIAAMGRTGIVECSLPPFGHVLCCKWTCIVRSPSLLGIPCILARPPEISSSPERAHRFIIARTCLPPRSPGAHQHNNNSLPYRGRNRHQVLTPGCTRRIVSN